ncbi:MAG: drug/metabolite transporter (DMT)-like permease [Gammaproteobacteria bacterium]|jgi:drug/metabolite transporter (DMT)-like permease
MTDKSNSQAYFLLIFVTWGWGCNAIFGKIAVGQISPMSLVSLRWIGVLILLLIFARRQVVKDWPVLRQHLVYLALMGMAGFTLFNALFYVAAHKTSAINIGIIQGSIPVFVFLGTYLFFHTKISSVQITGACITFIGVIIVATKGEITQLLNLTINQGDLFMLLACFLYATYSIGLSRRPDVSPLSLFTLLAGFAFLGSLPLLAIEIHQQGFQAPTTTGWVIAGLVTLLPSFISQLMFIHAIGLVGPGRSGMFVNLVPIFASIMAVFYLGETFEVFHALSLGLVLCGICLAEFGKRHTLLAKA